jgi:hypothetical protein
LRPVLVDLLGDRPAGVVVVVWHKMIPAALPVGVVTGYSLSAVRRTRARMMAAVAGSSQVAMG